MRRGSIRVSYSYPSRYQLKNLSGIKRRGKGSSNQVFNVRLREGGKFIPVNEICYIN